MLVVVPIHHIECRRQRCLEYAEDVRRQLPPMEFELLHFSFLDEGMVLFVDHLPSCHFECDSHFPGQECQGSELEDSGRDGSIELAVARQITVEERKI